MCFNRRNRINLNELKTIANLEKHETLSKKDLVHKREQIKICVLDDEGFSNPQLNGLGYKNIVVRESFDNIKDFAKYHIVLCDVDGVGNKLDKTKQGLAVAEEISKSYFPNTIVAIYSGKDLVDYDYNEIDNITTISKNIETSVLVEKLDELASSFWMPSKMWRHLEKFYRDNKLSNIEIALLEDSYVNSINYEDANHFYKKAGNTSFFNSDNISKFIELGAIIANTIINIYNAT